MKYRHLFHVGSALVLCFCLGLAGCTRSPGEAPQEHAPAVTVSYPIEREVTDYQDYTGRTAAVDSVQIQARVTGYLDKINFKEGVEVTEGSVLYEIDPRPYQDAYDAAKAQVAANVASLELAKQTNARNKRLAKASAGAISQEALDTSQSQENQAIGNLDTAQANLESAKLNLGWTKITAPVTGLIGRLFITRGNLITANQTILTTIVRQDPMWVYFDVDEPTMLRVHELIRQGKFGPAPEGRPPKVPFHLQLANEKGFPHQAILDFVNNEVDQATATLLIRAVFPNPLPANGPRVFTANNFVRVRVPTSGPYQALLVSPEAIGTDQDIKYLYTVDEENKIVRHAVKLGSLQDGLQAITDGIKLGERIIVNGMQHVLPGIAVNPTLVQMPTPALGSLQPPVVEKTPAPPPVKSPAPPSKR